MDGRKRSHSSASEESSSASSSSDSETERQIKREGACSSSPLPAKSQRRSSRLINSRIAQKFPPKTEPSPKGIGEKRRSTKRNSKDSNQQPSKKPHIWSQTDEMVFCNALLEFSKQGMDIHQNMTRIQEAIKGYLEFQYTRIQLVKKVRRLRLKYQDVMQKMKEGGFQERSFPFKSPHDRNLFNIWKQIWKEKATASEDSETETLEAAERVASRIVLALEAVDVRARDSKERPATAAGTGEAEDAAGDGTSKGPDNQGDSIPRLRHDSENTRAAVRWAGFVETQLKAVRHRALDDPVKSQLLEQKWRKQHILEIEVFCRRLALLQEASDLCLEGLRSHAAGHDKS